MLGPYEVIISTVLQGGDIGRIAKGCEGGVRCLNCWPRCMAHYRLYPRSEMRTVAAECRMSRGKGGLSSHVLRSLGIQPSDTHAKLSQGCVWVSPRLLDINTVLIHAT